MNTSARTLGPFDPFSPFGGPGRAAAVDLAVAEGLGAHVQACDRARGRAFGLRCSAERIHDLVGPRLFTTVFAATALLTLLAGCV